MFPKAIPINNLFGYVNKNTNEWNDGVISQAVDDLMNQKNINNHNWLLFDGPPDPSWVENLNTVLDENRILCFSNG